MECYRQYLTWAARFNAFRQSGEKLPSVPVEIYKDVLEGWMGEGDTMVSPDSGIRHFWPACGRERISGRC